MFSFHKRFMDKLQKLCEEAGIDCPMYVDTPDMQETQPELYGLDELEELLEDDEES